ncbi:hypothetical protein [Aeoliella sp. SH292]|uniref:hypothetical protein n=1 Tax=Aeoliella sp. SH292 TaxID=3454464 RepID=UPI003F95AB69
MTNAANNPPQRMPFSVWPWMIGIACLLVALGLRAFYLSQIEVPAWAKSKIQIGMDRSEVLELLGPPSGPRSTEKFFDYDRPEAPGWFVVEFDDNGKVTNIDDESF